MNASAIYRSKPQTTTLAQMSSAKQMTAGTGAGWSPDFSGAANPQPAAAAPGSGDAMIFPDLFSTNTAVPVSNPSTTE